MRISKLVISNSVLCLFILAQAAFSQNPLDVFGGYSLDRQGGSVAHGWNVSVAANVTDYFAVVADLSRHGIPEGGGGFPGTFIFSSDAHVMTYRFGPKFTYRMSRLELFAHTLIGGARLGAGAGFTAGAATYNASQTLGGWSTVAGGGLDVKVNPGLSVRVVQIEHNAWHFQGLASNGLRASFGVVFKFGGITGPN